MCCLNGFDSRDAQARSARRPVSVMSESLLGNVPDQALDEVGGDGFGGLDAVGRHLVAQAFENADDSFESASGRVVLVDAVFVVLPRPVDDYAAAIRKKLGP